MALIPRNDPLLHRLNNVMVENSPRPYLGISMIGHECHRYLQLYHYWAFDEHVSVRMKRLFQFGHDMESVFIKDLAREGYVVLGQQAEIVCCSGHWKGHIDGKVLKDGPPKLAEFKTHNLKSFKDLKSKKVKESKPEHYDQMQGYMGYMNMKEAFYLAYCKDNSEYYYEIVPFDPEYFKELQRKQREVIMAEDLLPRIGNNNPTWFKCKMCSAKDVCFGKKEVRMTCRSCAHVDVMDKGKWHCTKHDVDLGVNRQAVACPDYVKDIMFVEIE